MHSRELTQSAILPCEGRCGPSTSRHYFFRTGAPRARGLVDLIFRCQVCEHERVWGIAEGGILAPRPN